MALAVCGMGKVNAARAAQVLCSAYRPELLLLSGGAGGLAGDARPGDLVVATEVVQYDLGAWSTGGFRPAGRGAAWPASREWLARARGQAQRPAAQGPVPRFGVICSGDQVVAEAGKRAALARQFGALAVDMESAGVAQVAAANGVPWLAVRGISDGLADNDALSLNLPLAVAPLTLAGALEIYGGFAAELAGSPRKIGQLRAFLRRFREAGTVAAAFCLDVIAPNPLQ